ncbi:hypothetical protein H5407_23270 [Mitsuaria sp. WAJ17]|uniref:hypothetical protein n=1 Tax=Mitsuaria sp. WAJ17 TaxID=2761452 RepID=UPI0015FFD57C|nr:hypothetical protein [Mitsuaria sp. WAJ17]MBB2488159.1 hypothetical protein [Mitsuaria sp. WAJ17]
MNAKKRKLIVYVDVDDTLIRTFGVKRIPIVPAVERVRLLYASGAELYCWSSGGSEYAEASAREVGLASCFTAFLPKPNVLIDDQSVGSWRFFIEQHPLSNCSLGVDEYWSEIFSQNSS